MRRTVRDERQSGSYIHEAKDGLGQDSGGGSARMGHS